MKRLFEETKDNIKWSMSEARKEIPRYTKALNKYQDGTVDAFEVIGSNYIESQREIFRSFLSAWNPYLNYDKNPGILNFLVQLFEMYFNAFRYYGTYLVATARFTNNYFFVSGESYKSSLEQAKSNSKQLSDMSVNVAKTLEKVCDDVAKQGDAAKVAWQIFLGHRK